MRLPAEVAPERYDITVTPDAQAKTFRGSVRIAIDVKGETRRVVLNALELVIDRAVLPTAPPPRSTLDAKAQTATWHLPRALKEGRHVLLIDYRGKINPFSAGLFSLDYPSRRGQADAGHPVRVRRLPPLRALVGPARPQGGVPAQRSSRRPTSR